MSFSAKLLGVRQHLKRISLLSSVLFFCIGCDQVTKIAASHYLASSSPLSHVGDFFRLQYAENVGAFLGLGSALPSELRFWLLTILVGAVLLGGLFFVLANKGLGTGVTTGFCLIIGGGTSNLIDRTVHDGAVIDFINLGIGPFRTGIFNLADMAIMTGAGMLFLFGWSERRRSSRASNPSM